MKAITVVGETLAVLSFSQIRKTYQCLTGQVGETFLEIFENEPVISAILMIKKVHAD